MSLRACRCCFKMPPTGGIVQGPVSPIDLARVKSTCLQEKRREKKWPDRLTDIASLGTPVKKRHLPCVHALWCTHAGCISFFVLCPCLVSLCPSLLFVPFLLCSPLVLLSLSLSPSLSVLHPLSLPPSPSLSLPFSLIPSSPHLGDIHSILCCLIYLFTFLMLKFVKEGALDLLAFTLPSSLLESIRQVSEDDFLAPQLSHRQRQPRPRNTTSSSHRSVAAARRGPRAQSSNSLVMQMQCSLPPPLSSSSDKLQFILPSLFILSPD